MAGLHLCSARGSLSSQEPQIMPSGIPLRSDYSPYGLSENCLAHHESDRSHGTGGLAAAIRSWEGES